MPVTVIDRTLATATVYRPPDPEVVASTNEWIELASTFVVRPNVDTWWVAVSVVASVDPGVEGELRIVASQAGETSPVARIVSHVEPLLLGWLQLSWGSPAEQYVSLQGRRTVGSGGGVRVQKAAPNLMTAPPLAQQGGPNYPIGYDPGPQAPYPAHFEIADPYGG